MLQAKKFIAYVVNLPKALKEEEKNHDISEIRQSIENRRNKSKFKEDTKNQQNVFLCNHQTRNKSTNELKQMIDNELFEMINDDPPAIQLCNQLNTLTIEALDIKSKTVFDFTEIQKKLIYLHFSR